MAISPCLAALRSAGERHGGAGELRGGSERVIKDKGAVGKPRVERGEEGMKERKEGRLLESAAS